MCYGDPDYGRDGYYRDWLEQMNRQEEAERHYEQEQESQD